MTPPFASIRIVWAAMLAALAAYVVVLLVLLDRPGPAPAPNLAPLRAVFLALSAATVAGIVILRRRLPPIGADPARSAAPTPAAAYRTCIVGWAMAESIGLFGLVLGVLSRDVQEAVPFLVAGAALLLWQRPHREWFPVERPRA